MTKADIVNEISKKTGIDKATVLTTVEAFMEAVKTSMIGGKNVYLRGFGSFILKKRVFHGDRKGLISTRRERLLERFR